MADSMSCRQSQTVTNQACVQVAAVVNQGNLLPDQYVLQVSVLPATPI